MHSDLADQLERSLRRQERILRSSLVLNPVENFPFQYDIKSAAGIIHGLYNSDKVRTPEQQFETAHQFAGRNRLACDMRRIYKAWAQALHAADLSMRLLSGLHAHIVVFMALTRPGDRVLLLPELAGGHMSTKAILERLGLVVIEMAVDTTKQKIDIDQTIALAHSTNPRVVFVDRSEGLVYEDFGPLVSAIDARFVFDSSQYLTNILSGEFENPFSLGFDYMLASTHKNLPGPQKALIASRLNTEEWQLMLSKISTYVSNMHSSSTYAAGFILAREGWLRKYSQNMLNNAKDLEHSLIDHGIDAVGRPDGRPPTHHVWIRARSREQAFWMFKALERVRLLTNYRRLPYDLGFGLRLGLSAVTRLGLEAQDVSQLSDLIAGCIQHGPSARLRKKVRQFSEIIWSRANIET